MPAARRQTKSKPTASHLKFNLKICKRNQKRRVYEMEVKQNALYIRYGYASKYAKTHQVVKNFSTNSEAKKEAVKRVVQRMRDGYNMYDSAGRRRNFDLSKYQDEDAPVSTTPSIASTQPTTTSTAPKIQVKANTRARRVRPTVSSSIIAPATVSIPRASITSTPAVSHFTTSAPVPATPKVTVQDYNANIVQDPNLIQFKGTDQKQHWSISQIQNNSNVDKYLQDCYYQPGLLNTTTAPSQQVIFAFDCTHSMFNAIQNVKSKLQILCTQLLGDLPDIQIGMIAHGDYLSCEYNRSSNGYIMHKLDFSNELDHIGSFVKKLKVMNGRDRQECYEMVLREAQLMNWHPDCQNKCLVVIGDDEPHSSSQYLNLNWRDELQRLATLGVRVHSVQCLDRSHANYFYKELAEKGNGYHYQLSNFESMAEMFLGISYRNATDHRMAHDINWEELDLPMDTSDGSSNNVIIRPEGSSNNTTNQYSIGDADLLRIHEAIHAPDKPSKITIQETDYDISLGKAGCRSVRIHDITYVEQNKEKNSKYAKMALEGKKLTWIIHKGQWGLIIDHEIVRR